MKTHFLIGDCMNKKVLKISFIVLFSLLYFFVLFLNTARIPLNSDYANLILEAKDFWSGDVLLSNRYFTGITFYTTDLLYYVISYLFFGVDNFTFVLATALMCFMIAFAGTFLLKVKDKKFPWILFTAYIAFASLPEYDAIGMLRAHTPAAVYCLFALYFYNEWRNCGKTKHLVFSGILYLLAFAGDTSVLILFILPVIFIEGVEFLKAFCFEKNNSVEKRFYVIGSVFLAVAVVTFASEKLFFILNGSVKNAFVSILKFNNFEETGEHVTAYLYSIMDLFGAHFAGKPVLWASSFFYFFKFLFILIGFFAIIKSIIDIFKKQDYDFISSALSLGFVFISIVFTITVLSKSITSARYYACAPIIFGIVIIRQFQLSDFSSFSERSVRAFSIFILALSALFALNYLRKTDLRIAFSPKVRLEKCYKKDTLLLSEYLQKKGLKNGYSDFWTASIVSVYSHENTTIRSVNGLYTEGRDIKIHDWFAKKEWYKEPANFFVISPEWGTVFDLTEERVLYKFGTPSEYEEFNGYRIFIYDHDIALEK